MTTPLLQYVAWFDGGGSEIVGFGGGAYKESSPWCSLFVGFPSLFVAPSSEQLALPVRWRGTSLSTISGVFSAPYVSTSRALQLMLREWARVPAEGRRRRGVVAVCTRISSQEYVIDK